MKTTQQVEMMYAMEYESCLSYVELCIFLEGHLGGWRLGMVLLWAHKTNIWLLVWQRSPQCRENLQNNYGSLPKRQIKRRRGLSSMKLSKKDIWNAENARQKDICVDVWSNKFAFGGNCVDFELFTRRNVERASRSKDKRPLNLLDVMQDGGMGSLDLQHYNSVPLF